MPSSNSIKVDHLTLSFPLDFFAPTSWRDHFVQNFSFKKKSVELFSVVEDISFEFKNGDRVAILGRNGAGKSSLCRCIAGVYRPSKGKVLVQGSVRALFDSSVAFFPELTGRENISILVDLLYPKPTKEQKKEIETFTGIGLHLDRQLKFYSNGMQARLALAILSCQPADILILDEVFDGADVGFRKKIGKRMKAMIDQSGIVLFVSHSIDQVADTCNRVIVLEDHRIIHDGDVQSGLKLYSEICERHQ